MTNSNGLIGPARMAIVCVCLVLFLASICALIIFNPAFFIRSNSNRWHAPDTISILNFEQRELISYGRDLVKHTAVYLGPKGKVMRTTNGMNCQNCHLEGGTKFYGNNYSAVAANYPKFRARSGTKESIEKRVNDCIERSLNGNAIANDSREMRAFVAYIKWVGKDVPEKISPEGAGLFALPYLDRPADTVNGKGIYKKFCERCHKVDAKGEMAPNGLEWKYPPLRGENSFNVGAGLFRLSTMAGYVKMNMPNDLATYDDPELSDEESWDVCAYIVSLDHPSKDISRDWPDIATKPVDHPFGPYADNFSETQHKYGPFKPIKKAAKRGM